MVVAAVVINCDNSFFDVDLNKAVFCVKQSLTFSLFLTTEDGSGFFDNQLFVGRMLLQIWIYVQFILRNRKRIAFFSRFEIRDALDDRILPLQVKIGMSFFTKLPGTLLNYGIP